MVFIFLFLRRFTIFSKINKIQSSNEQSVEIICKSVAFLTQPISKNSAVIVCIILTDENGKKYYDVVNGISDCVRKGTRTELLNKTVSLTCYENTNFVKTYQVPESFSAGWKLHKHGEKQYDGRNISIGKDRN